MEHTLFLWESSGAVIIFLLGSFIHFGYELTNKINLFTVFFAVNESVWEHAKLTFWAPIIYGIIEYFFIGQFFHNFLTAKTISALITTIAMIALFYTYRGITERHSLVADLIIYEISIIIGLVVSYKMSLMSPLLAFANKISIFVIIFFIFIFYIFSYKPPKAPVFKCGATGKYGI